MDEKILNEDTNDDNSTGMSFSLTKFLKYLLFLPTCLCILYGIFVLPNHYGPVRRAYFYPLSTEEKLSVEGDTGVRNDDNRHSEKRKEKEGEGEERIEKEGNSQTDDYITGPSEETKTEDCCVVEAPLNAVKNLCDKFASKDPTSSLELGKEVPSTSYTDNITIEMESTKENINKKLDMIEESTSFEGVTDKNYNKNKDHLYQQSTNDKSFKSRLNTFYPNINLCQMIFTVEFWLIFTIFVITMGTCLTVINNIASIIDAFSSTEGTVVALLLFGILETLGRLSVSFSDLFHHFVLVRVAFLYCTIITIFLCSILLAFANLYTLNIAIYLVAYLYGFLYSSMIALVADLFGLSHFGSNLGLTLFAPIIGSFLCSTGLVSFFYTDDCSGSACFKNVFLTEAALLIIASVLCLVLQRKLMYRAQINSIMDIFLLNK